MGELWFGHYRLDRLIGSGGTGEVWLAYNTTAGRAVALKVLAAVHAASTPFRRRFTREARLAAQVRGPHLVPIHSFGELDGRLYIEMEFIDGLDVAALLRRHGCFEPEQAVEIVAQTATALDAAHRAGLVHRDVKPSNIMVQPDGMVYLIDFGTAHRGDQPAITVTGNVVGTLAYMAPERFDGAAGSRADQYSLACVLYECLTGRRPFGNGDAPRLVRAHLLDTPPLASALDPGIPAALDTVIVRGMAKDPDRRWSSAGELASAAYAAVMGRDATTVELMPAVSTVVRPPRRRTWAAGSRMPYARTSLGPRLALAAFAVLVAAVAGALWFGRPEPADSGPAAAPVSSSKQERTSHSEPPALVPAAPAPISAPTHVVPAPGLPCDPAVDVHGVVVDGIRLTCTPLAAGRADWIPSWSNSSGPGPEKIDNGPNDSGGDSRGKSKPDHSKQGNGKDKPRPHR
ncbi:serine/threonine protein kinase [Nocardia amamiensis]|uniref:non-specific serine/threonine protein kinase n=1 Tax=Nocardia amamiensis TaxID=404578 RepID=A0ABS0CR12_9NOCA|nr:serine/threonine-protein kinase [Nocardia amamiensis]MBF6298721.1 serine/threonine protein kinase [Nocardia amamiensis]